MAARQVLGRANVEDVAVARAKRGRRRRQYAALPLARGADGELLVILVTSRETHRWIIPKGWPEKGLEPHELAAKEAYEEAGLVGDVAPESIGSYRYAKRLRGRKTVTCEVDVFPFMVERQLDDWPERGQREVRWCTPEEAALLVEEGKLVAMLLELAAPNA